MLKKGIMETKVSWDLKYSGNQVNGGEIPDATTRYIYLLSLREIYNITMEKGIGFDGFPYYPSITANNETRWLDYYKSVGADKNKSNAIKKYNGTATKWWTRSMHYKGNFINVNEDGDYILRGDDWYSIDNEYKYGVSPAFRISE